MSDTSCPHCNQRRGWPISDVRHRIMTEHQLDLLGEWGIGPIPGEPVVVHVNDGYDVYIGRTCRGHTDIGLGNPYVIGRDGDRSTVIADYRLWLKSRPDLHGLVAGLTGKRLGCWCRHHGQRTPACHGDVLIEAWKCLSQGTPWM